MAYPRISTELAQQAIDKAHVLGSEAAAAEALGVARTTFREHIRAARRYKLIARGQAPDDPKLLKLEIKALKDALREKNQQSDELAQIKAVIGSLRTGVENLTAPEWVAKAPQKPSSPGVPMLFLSDLHWGERVFASQINGVNSYNLAIARERLNYTVETAINLLRILDNGMNYPGLVMPLGGDMISGNIHEELTATNELNTMPTVLDLYGQLVGVIGRMADTFGAVFLPCVTGNHGRDTRKVWAKDRHHTSFDWLLYRFLAKHFEKDKRVTFYIPDGSDALFRLYNTRFNLTHGDQFRGGDGLIGPLGPITRGDHKKRSRNSQIDMDYDVLMMGHFHTYTQLTWLLINGSLKGYDEYAFVNNFKFEKPQQALCVVHSRHGITYRMPVYCDPGQKGRETTWVGVPGGK